MTLNTCSICINDENDTELINTPCSHLFHLECLKNLTRPKCPLCNKDIKLFMIENGVSKKIIAERISADNLRINYDTLKVENYWKKHDVMMLFLMSSLAKQINKDKWLEVYSNIIYDIIGNVGRSFLTYSNANYDADCQGLFLVHIDVSTFLQIILDNYSSGIIQWRDISEFKMYPKFVSKANMLYKQVKKDYENSFGVMIAFEDDSTNKLYMTTKVLTVEKGKKMLTNISLIRSVCECDNIRVAHGEKIQVEKDWINKLNYEEVYDDEPTIMERTYNYKYFSDFITENIVFKDKDLKYICIDIIYPDNPEIMSYKIKRNTTFATIYTNTDTKRRETLKYISTKIAKYCKENKYEKYSVMIDEVMENHLNEEIKIRKQYVIEMKEKYIVVGKVKSFYLAEMINVDENGKKVLSDDTIIVF